MGKSQVNLPQMPPFGSGICMGDDSRNHPFAPGLPPGGRKGRGELPPRAGGRDHQPCEVAQIKAWISHRGECFWKIRFRGTSIRFATKMTTHLLLDVTGSFLCVTIFVEKLYFSGILIRKKSRPGNLAISGLAGANSPLCKGISNILPTLKSS